MKWVCCPLCFTHNLVWPIAMGMLQAELSDAYRKILLDAPPKLLGDIIVSQCQKMVEKCSVASQYVKPLCTCLKYAPQDLKLKGGALHLSLSLLGDQHIQLAAQSQSGLVLAMSERILRALDASVIVQSGWDLQSLLPSIKDFEEDGLLKGKSELLECGWFSQSLLDLHCVQVVGLVLENIMNKEPLSRDLRRQAMAIMANEGHLSSRVKALFKPIAGSTVQHARTAWEHMKQLKKTAQEHTNIIDDAIGGVRDNLSTLKAAVAADNFEDSYEMLEKLLDEQKKTMDALVGMFGCDAGAESVDACMDKSGKELAQDLIDTLLKAVDLILKHKGAAVIDFVTPLFAVGFVAEGAEALRQQYIETGEDLDPEGYAILHILSEVVSVLRQGAGGDSKLKAIETMLNLAADVFFVWADFSKPDSAAETAMKRWAKLYGSFLELNKAPVTVYERFFDHSAMFFQDLRKELDMDRLIASFLTETMGDHNGKASQALWCMVWGGAGRRRFLTC